MATKRPARKTPSPDKVPSEPREIPSHCPLFPTYKTSSVGKVVLKRITYDDTGAEEHQYIAHPRVNAEMDVEDIQAVAGGGEFYVAIHRNDGTGQLITHRKIQIEGPPRDYDDDLDEGDDEDDEKEPIIIRNKDGTTTVVPRMKPGEQAAYLAQQDRIKSLEKQAENGGGGGGMAAVLGGVMQMQMKSSEQTTQMLIAMMQGGGQNNAAVTALQAQLAAVQTEKATMIADHGRTVAKMMDDHSRALADARAEHAKTADALRAELAKTHDESRRLAALMETRVETAVLDAKRRAAEENAKLAGEVARLEAKLLDAERSHLRTVAEMKGSSETIELAKLAIPRLDALLGKVGGDGKGGLPPELQATIDLINKEVAPVVRALKPMADQLTADQRALPEKGSEAPAPAANGAAPAVNVPVPEMPV